jgi:hypothetical protein
MGAAGVLVQRRLESERRREARCSFCGVYSPSGVGLERAPRFQGAAICPRCAAIIAQRYGELGEAKESKGPENVEAIGDASSSAHNGKPGTTPTAHKNETSGAPASTLEDRFRRTSPDGGRAAKAPAATAPYSDSDYSEEIYD